MRRNKRLGKSFTMRRRFIPRAGRPYERNDITIRGDVYIIRVYNTYWRACVCVYTAIWRITESQGTSIYSPKTRQLTVRGRHNATALYTLCVCVRGTHCFDIQIVPGPGFRKSYPRGKANADRIENAISSRPYECVATAYIYVYRDPKYVYIYIVIIYVMVRVYTIIRVYIQRSGIRFVRIGMPFVRNNKLCPLKWKYVYSYRLLLLLLLLLL